MRDIRLSFNMITPNPTCSISKTVINEVGWEFLPHPVKSPVRFSLVSLSFQWVSWNNTYNNDQDCGAQCRRFSTLVPNSVLIYIIQYVSTTFSISPYFQYEIVSHLKRILLCNNISWQLVFVYSAPRKFYVFWLKLYGYCLSITITATSL